MPLNIKHAHYLVYVPQFIKQVANDSNLIGNTQQLKKIEYFFYFFFFGKDTDFDAKPRNINFKAKNKTGLNDVNMLYI